MFIIYSNYINNYYFNLNLLITFINYSLVFIKISQFVLTNFARVCPLN